MSTTANSNRTVDRPEPNTVSKATPTSEPNVDPGFDSRVNAMTRPIGIPRKNSRGEWEWIDPDVLTEQTSLAEAQTALARRREDLHIEPATAAQAEASARFDETETLSDVLQDVVRDAAKLAGVDLPVATPAVLPGGHLKRPSYPLPPLVPSEAQVPMARLDPEQLQLARIDANVPESFTVCPAGCPWTNGMVTCKRCSRRLVPVTWALLAKLVNKSDMPALGGVEDLDGRLLHGEEAVAELRRRMAAEHVVLLGRSRVGKSLSAAAFVDAELRAGVHRVRWMSPFALRDNPVERAVGAKTLILDDIGEEMAAAESFTGLSAQRSMAIDEVVAALARSRGKRLIVTTYLSEQRMEKLYGGGVAARIYDGADVIVLRRADSLPIDP